MYAECAVRGAGGSLATATTYVNALRTRANGPSVTQGDLNLNFILDERAKNYTGTQKNGFGSFW
jgi:hypothetical protein